MSVAVEKMRVVGGEVVPSAHAKEDFQRTPFVDHRFVLDRSVLGSLRAFSPPWGWTGLSEALYYRSYSREKKDGTQESWPDTVVRFIEGVLSIRKDHCTKRRLPWDDAEWRDYGAQMAYAAARFEWSPPGRGLWAMGTDYVYERGAAALTNCAYVDIDAGHDIAHSLGWGMDMLMCGAGVGFGISSKPVTMSRPSGPEVIYDVCDTRESWVESYELLIRSYLYGTNPVSFRYGRIRKEGLPLRGIGGSASGPDPLIKTHRWAREALDRYLRGEFGATRLKGDLANFLGVCVSMGGIRRSSEILLGSVHDDEFLSLKDYEKHPERADWGWSSNNTVLLETHEDFLGIQRIAEGIRRNGEPGVANLVNMRKFARFGREEPDAATGLNPCQPAWATLLTPNGIRTMGEIDVGDHVWSGQHWTKVVRKVPTGVKPVYAYKTRAGTFYGTENHRVVQEGEKIEVKDAQFIDISWCESRDCSGGLDPVDVMDGLVVGDGSVHNRKQNDFVFLVVGAKDHDYFTSDVRDLFKEKLEHRDDYWVVQTTITPEELPVTRKRIIPSRFLSGEGRRVCGFLRGLFSANGSVNKYTVCLTASSFSVIESAQMMLSSIGIRSCYHKVSARVTRVKGKEASFSEKYRLMISTDRFRFMEMVGFIQSYKTETLAKSFAEKQRVFSSPRKESFEVTEVVSLGDEEVYDITVDAEEHTYWTSGLLVSNCGEICLEPFETCIVDNLYPSRCNSWDKLAQATRFATFYNSTVALLPTHRSETNRIVSRNRRIGVSIAGLADWLTSSSDEKVTRNLRDVYKVIREENARLAREAGVPVSIRVSTCKPDGSVAKLPGVSEGVHAHKYPYAVRRMSVKNGHPVIAVLLAAGYPSEPTATQPDLETTFEFPIAAPDGSRTVKDQTIWEQLSIAVMMQREFSDNSVSITGEFDPEREGEDVVRALARNIPMLKSFSVLPRATKFYKQLPYEEITREEYDRRRAALRPLDWTGFHGDGEDEKFCVGGMCHVKTFGKGDEKETIK